MAIIEKVQFKHNYPDIIAEAVEALRLSAETLILGFSSIDVIVSCRDGEPDRTALKSFGGAEAAFAILLLITLVLDFINLHSNKNDDGNKPSAITPYIRTAALLASTISCILLLIEANKPSNEKIDNTVLMVGLAFAAGSLVVSDTLSGKNDKFWHIKKKKSNPEAERLIKINSNDYKSIKHFLKLLKETTQARIVVRVLDGVRTALTIALLGVGNVPAFPQLSNPELLKCEDKNTTGQPSNSSSNDASSEINKNAMIALGISEMFYAVSLLSLLVTKTIKLCKLTKKYQKEEANISGRLPDIYHHVKNYLWISSALGFFPVILSIISGSVILANLDHQVSLTAGVSFAAISVLLARVFTTLNEKLTPKIPEEYIVSDTVTTDESVEDQTSERAPDPDRKAATANDTVGSNERTELVEITPCPEEHSSPRAAH